MFVENLNLFAEVFSFIYILSSILQQMSLVYSEPCQTSRMERFAEIVNV